MKLPNTKYTGSYIKGEFQGSSGPVNVSNSSSRKYYGNMIDAPGFLNGGSVKKKTHKMPNGKIMKGAKHNG